MGILYGLAYTALAIVVGAIIDLAIREIFAGEDD